MRAHRRSIRLLPAIALLAALLVPGLAGSALATTTVLEGTIAAEDGVTWSEDAVAVVTLVDMSAKPEAGAILGQQRIDGPGAAPIAYEVLYDDSRVDPKGAYAAYATIVDGDSVYATPLPVPVLTGGPDTGVELAIAAVPAYPASITGSVTPPAGISLSPTAVTTEVLVKESDGHAGRRPDHRGTDERTDPVPDRLRARPHRSERDVRRQGRNRRRRQRLGGPAGRPRDRQRRSRSLGRRDGPTR